MSHFNQKPEILVVDDEVDIRFLLGNILKQKNIQTVFASSLSEADKITKEQREFACIFLDNYLPDGLGVDYIKRLKKKFPQSKIVMVTAHDNLADREKAKKEGADYFIGKPFSRDCILKTLDNFTI